MFDEIRTVVSGGTGTGTGAAAAQTAVAGAGDEARTGASFEVTRESTIDARATHVGRGREPVWRAIDRALRSCASRRAALDAEEARWLVAAEHIALHRQLGCASIHEYLERVLGYTPRMARERLRVARALAELPAMMSALAAGELSHSAVRELTRVATPETEAAWLDAARGCTLRELEEAVSGRERGARPDDPPDGEPRPLRIELELSPSTMALYRDALRWLEVEAGERLTDDQAVAAMCRAVLAGERVADDADTDDADADDADDAEADDADTDDADADDADADDADADADDADTDDAEPGDDTTTDDSTNDPVDDARPRDRAAPRADRPPYQIAVTVCATCQRGWHDAGGRAFALTRAELATASCDADVLGRVDGGGPAHLSRSIPPSVRRQVMRRDRGRCIVPGCRAARYLHVHHVIPWAVGGDHDPRRLCLLCAGHHLALHAGLIVIRGEAPAFEIVRVGDGPALARAASGLSEPSSGQPSAPPDERPRVTATHVGRDAVAALTQLGFARGEAIAAVNEATVLPGRTLEDVIKIALRALRPAA